MLFSSSPLFMLHLLSWGPFLMLTITIFLSWDPLHSPYAPSNPYTIPCITTGQGISFCLSLLSHGWLLLQLILSYWLHTPLTHSPFHDIPWHSVLTQQDILPHSAIFFCLVSRSLLEYTSPCTCTYSILLICAIHASYLSCLESLAPRPNQLSPLVHFVAPELAKLLITSISLHPTLKDSLLFYLCLSLQVYVLLWRTLSSFFLTICDTRVTIIYILCLLGSTLLAFVISILTPIRPLQSSLSSSLVCPHSPLGLCHKVVSSLHWTSIHSLHSI